MFMLGAASSGKSYLVTLLANAFGGKQIDAIQSQSDFQPISIMNADIIYTNEWNSSDEMLLSDRAKQVIDPTQPTCFRAKYKDNFMAKRGQMFILTTNKSGKTFQDLLKGKATEADATAFTERIVFIPF
jgi:nicotinamide riboside kinase